MVARPAEEEGHLNLAAAAEHWHLRGEVVADWAGARWDLVEGPVELRVRRTRFLP